MRLPHHQIKPQHIGCHYRSHQRRSEMNNSDEYKNLKTEYDDLQLKLKQLNDSWKKSYDIWSGSKFEDKKQFKKTSRIEREKMQTQRLAKSISYKLVILDYQENDISVSQLAKKYNLAISTVYKLFKENNVLYIRPEMLRWRPITSAPKDRPIMIRKLHQIGIAIHNPSIFGGWQMCSSVCFFQEETQSNMSNEALPLPTHWMPLPGLPND